MLRLFDIFFSFIGLLVAIPVMVLLWAIGFLDTGSPVFKQTRVGRFQEPFQLIKFRTMKIGVPNVASHLSDVSAITSLGSFLRRTKLDELPQLWNVLRGDMSLVGPRPCLLNQTELIKERAKRGVFDVRPGITGLAQINGIDMSTPLQLAETDKRMLEDLNVLMYFRYIFQTLVGKGAGDSVKGMK